MESIDLIVAALATFRLTMLISVDDGPLDVFLRLRNWLLDLNMKYPDSLIRKTFYDGITCPYCLGIYSSVFILLLMTAFPSVVGNYIIYILAIAGGQALIQKVLDRMEQP